MKVLIYEDDADCANVLAELCYLAWPTCEVVIDLGSKKLQDYCEDPTFNILISDFSILTETQLPWFFVNYDSRLIFVSGYIGQLTDVVKSEYVWLAKDNMPYILDFLGSRVLAFQIGRTSRRA